MTQQVRARCGEAQRATARGRAFCARRPDGLGANTACEPVDPQEQKWRVRARAARLVWGEVRMEPLFNLRNETPSSRSDSAMRGGQEVGGLPGRADESSEKRRTFRGPHEDLLRCASDNSMLIRPEIFEG